MAEAGLLEEVAGLASRLGRTASRAVGYRQLLDHLRGATSLDRAWEEVRRATAALARRQRTFFRRDPRIRWIKDDARRGPEAVLQAWGLR
jgi:tRNA dimethylallyltransferase